jgi:protein ImuB
MNHQQSLPDLELPVPPRRPVPVRVHEVPAAGAEPAAARELWAAVQLGTVVAEPDDLPEEAYPAALAVLVKRAGGFTPRVAVESNDAVLLELAGSQGLFGGLPGLLGALRAAFPRPLQLALAPTPLAAVLLARAGRNCCITTPARLAGKLASLSLRHLHWPEEEQARLRSMGVNTLGELLRLPRAGLARRLGPERLRQLDQITGTRSDPRQAIAPDERFSERIEPDYETLQREPLLAALQPTLVRLEEFLRARQRGVMGLRLRLYFRRALPQFTLVRCVVPEYRAARFAALLAARLESLPLSGPVQRMELTAGRPRRFVAASSGLWAAGEHGGDAAAQAAPEFLQTLTARLGTHAVYGLAQLDEHRPERQYRGVAPLATERAPAAAAVDRLRPLGLMPVPQALDTLLDAAGQVRQLRHAGRELQLVSGPERIESGWWDGEDIARDYYIARTTDGARWWVFREGASRRWFLHGCFA